MSYDLDFWKYKPGIYLHNQEVYEQCSEKLFVEGLEELPIERIKKDVTIEFLGWSIAEDHGSWQNTEGKGAFEIYTTTQFVWFDCYGMSGDDMNRLIDIMLRYDCPLYDPQVTTRFDGKEKN
ncbi:hypothetical protein ACTHGU_00145 [Chitinophagaceae bacterium MMS25-I14]